MGAVQQPAGQGMDVVGPGGQPVLKAVPGSSREDGDGGREGEGTGGLRGRERGKDGLRGCVGGLLLDGCRDGKRHGRKKGSGALCAGRGWRRALVPCEAGGAGEEPYCLVSQEGLEQGPSAL